MKKLLLLLIIPFLSFGQGWVQTFWTADCYSILQTNDGGYIMCGDTYEGGSGSEDIYVVKTTENGDEQWSQTYGSTSTEHGFSIEKTIDDGYIVCGTTYYNMAGAHLLKIDQFGQEQWSQTYGENVEGYGMMHGGHAQQTNDGGYIITGRRMVGHESPSGGTCGNNDVVLLKTDENGEQQWLNNFYVSECWGESGHRVYQTSSGGYIVGGSYFGENSGIVIFKIDENGEEQWSQTYEASGYNGLSDFEETNDGGYIFGYSDIIIKVNSNGFQEWSQTYGEAVNAGVGAIAQTNDGGYIIGGTTGEGYDYNNYNLSLIKTDEAGNEQWSQTYDLMYEFRCHDIEQTSDGGYIIGGELNNNACLIKTNELGNINSTNIIETPTINKTLITTVDILGKATTKKGFQLHIYDDGAFEKKYVIK